jgi:sugar/nucleoside kinase (ribokinase family)
VPRLCKAHGTHCASADSPTGTIPDPLGAGDAFALLFRLSENRSRGARSAVTPATSASSGNGSIDPRVQVGK